MRLRKLVGEPVVRGEFGAIAGEGASAAERAGRAGNREVIHGNLLVQVRSNLLHSRPRYGRSARNWGLFTAFSRFLGETFARQAGLWADRGPGAGRQTPGHLFFMSGTVPCQLSLPRMMPDGSPRHFLSARLLLTLARTHRRDRAQLLTHPSLPVHGQIRIRGPGGLAAKPQRMLSTFGEIVPCSV